MTQDGKLEDVPVAKENLVRFTLHDGIIGSLCASEDEPTWTGNVKRAIISLLQNKALNGITDNEVIEVSETSQLLESTAIFFSDLTSVFLLFSPTFPEDVRRNTQSMVTCTRRQRT